MLVADPHDLTSVASHKCGFIFQALFNDIPLRNLGGIFDRVNDSHDFINDSRSASPTPSLISNRSGF